MDLRDAGSPEAWLEAQLSPGSIPQAAKIATVDGWFADQLRTPAQKWSDQVGQVKGGWVYGHELGNLTILRRIYSTRSVLETMTDFWSTNLHVPVGHDRAWIYRHDYDATIRRLALGRFEDLLRETALHPAMRTYLDNDRSVRGKPNENQGRELLELHTVGRAAGYTEAMVKASAVILSGYTVYWSTTKEPYYNPAAHTTGPVQVLDFSHANADADGQAVTLAYLRHLARHPATARNVATKLARYFCGDSPSDGLVDALAAAYLQNDTDISAVLRTLAAHPEFLTSEGMKVRTPVADMVATARVLGVDVTAPPTQEDSWSNAANWTHGGMTMFSWPRPDGPPVTNGTYATASRLFASYRMHTNIAGGWWPRGATYRNGVSWMPATSLTFDAFVDHVSRAWLGRPADARILQAARQGVANQWVNTSASASITSSHPVVTWQFWRLVTALLDSPEHMTT